MLSRRVVPQLTRALTRAASSSSSKPSSSVPAKAAETTTVPAPQAPNYATTWSTNQQQRPAGGSNPRFEQTAMELQPNPLSAMEMVANEPVRLVHGRRAVCDGGMPILCVLNPVYSISQSLHPNRRRSFGSSQDFHQFGMKNSKRACLVEC